MQSSPSLIKEKAVIATLERTAKDLAAIIREKGKADDRILRGYSDHEKEVLALERDAVGLALDIAFDDREGLVTDRKTKIRATSFLSMLQMRHLEDDVIRFDVGRYPGLQQLAGETPEIRSFEHKGAVLEVIHANRNQLEKTLGVDLIYVSHYFKSFAGIQYKMLEATGSGAHFSPDKQFIEQLEKMATAEARLSPIGPAVSQLDYRLRATPFFFKFVSRLEQNFSDDALCPGMYMPADLVRQVTSVPPNKILHPTGTRYLSNTEFANLFRQGWLGTCSLQTNQLKEMVTSALQERHSLVVAIDLRDKPRERGRRRARQHF
jgi:hypothetical protein